MSLSDDFIKKYPNTMFIDTKAAGRREDDTCPCPCVNVNVKDHGDGTATCVGECPAQVAQ